MEFCKVTLTFDSADKILRCDHSNESYLLFKIPQNKIWKFGRNLLSAKFGSERVKEKKEGDKKEIFGGKATIPHV